MSSWYYPLLKSDFASFIGKTLATADPGARYLPNWHIDLIAEYLEAARRGEITRLIINMPPRALKSICVSVAWPAWLLGHDPTARIMAASYSASLAVKHSIDCRQVVTSPWYQQVFPHTKLARDQNEKHKFMTTERGFRFATSVGGGATGEGGNFLIVDDPLNPAQAMNVSSRARTNRWFDHTFATRLNDKRKGAIVLVMQRLHQHDLSGYLLEKGGWTHLCLPAVAEKNEIHDFGNITKERVSGELLHENRENQELIGRVKNEIGSAAFSAQYQQRPIPEEGNMVWPWWFGRYTTLPPTTRCVQSWDTAIKSGANHDASVCLTFKKSEGKSYLCDVRSMRLEYPDLKRAIYGLAAQWKPDAILIEDKSSGQQLLQDIRRESHLPLIAVTPKGDKQLRFAAVCAMIEAGKLLLPEQASWLADFENEIFSFPNTAHDDQVDELAQYLDWQRNRAFQSLQLRRI